MSNLSAFLAEDISVAALLEETRTRVVLGMVLWPAVSEAIANRRRVGKWLSDLEIRRAIDSGRITDRNRTRRPTDSPKSSFSTPNFSSKARLSGSRLARSISVRARAEWHNCHCR